MDNNTKTASFSIKKETIETFDKYCKANHLKRSEIVNTLITTWLMVRNELETAQNETESA